MFVALRLLADRRLRVAGRESLKFKVQSPKSKGRKGEEKPLKIEVAG
jgi:hypothetical protein